MVITCADSRLQPTEIFHAKPGEIFTIRNVGALVPPFHGIGAYRSTAAALEFAVAHLKVSSIVILGHQNCGAIDACNKQKELEGTHLGAWLTCLHDLPHGTTATQMEQNAVRNSVENLRSYAFIQERVNQKKLSILGAWFSLPEAELHWIEPYTS